MNERTCVPDPIAPRSRPESIGRRASGATLRRRSSMVVGVLVAFLTVGSLGGFGPGGVAHAENTVVNSSPADGSLRDVSPDTILITFAEELGDGPNRIALTCEAELVPLPDAVVGDDKLSLSVDITEPLSRGTCTARWDVTDTEEVASSGFIAFTISNDTSPAPGDTNTDNSLPDDATTIVTVSNDDGSGEAVADESASDKTVVTDLARTDSGQGPLWLGRLLSTLAVSTLFGALVVIAAAWPEGVEYLVTVRFIRTVWAIALVGSLLFTAAATAAVTGSGLGSGFNPTAWLDLLDAGWAGRAVLIRLVFVIASAWVAFRPDRAIDPTTQIIAFSLPMIAVVCVGVTRTIGDLAIVGVALGALHALGAAVWVGGVILVARVVVSGPGEEDLIHAVRGFGRVSVIAIVVTVATGVIQMIRLDGGALFDAGHGRLVVLKAVVVAAMIFVAISARQFVAQRLARAQEMNLALSNRLRRAFGAEAGIGVITFALSAWLLALAPANIDTSPTIDYRIDRDIQIDAADLDIAVRLTDDKVGPIGLEVEVVSPESGLSGLSIVFTAPPNAIDLGTITQAIPLTGPGRAVRTEANGLPFDVAGDWGLQLNAVVGGSPVSSDELTFRVLQADGSEAEQAPATFPEVNIVTIPAETIPAEN